MLQMQIDLPYASEKFADTIRDEYLRTGAIPSFATSCDPATVRVVVVPDAKAALDEMERA